MYLLFGLVFLFLPNSHFDCALVLIQSKKDKWILVKEFMQTISNRKRLKGCQTILFVFCNVVNSLEYELCRRLRVFT